MSSAGTGDVWGGCFRVFKKANSASKAHGSSSSSLYKPSLTTVDILEVRRLNSVRMAVNAEATNRDVQTGMDTGQSDGSSLNKNGKTKVYTRTAGPATNGVPSAYRPRTLERSSSGGAAGRRHHHMRHVASLHEIVEGRTLDLDSPTGDTQDEVTMDEEVRVSKVLIRVLNARERRRFDAFRMLPVDAINPAFKRRVLYEFDIQLYEYGGSGEDYTEEETPVSRTRESKGGRRESIRLEEDSGDWMGKHGHENLSTTSQEDDETQILIAFCKNDPVFEALVTASHRLNFEPTFVKSHEAAIEAFQNVATGGHHIIVVDARHPRIIEADALGSVFEKDDTAVISLLDVGFNRCIIESPHVSICSSELRQIQHSLVRPQNVISTQQALYTALHRSREAIIITDDSLRAQYANRASERILNMKLDEIVGRSLSELVTADVSNILSQTSRHKDYEGFISTRRKSQETLHIHVRAVPVSCIGRSPTHLVLILESPASGTTLSALASDALQTLPQGKEVARGSLHSIRRGSFDVRSIASDGLRRTSLAKLSQLPLEAPITKVLSLLAQVQENCSQDESKLLDRVMEFLKREGLYSPQMKEIRTEDPVATDLIGALLTQGPTNTISSRRSSNDSIIRGGGRPSTGSIVFTKTRESTQLNELLNNALAWDFEIFRLEELTERHPLVCLGKDIFVLFFQQGPTNTISSRRSSNDSIIRGGGRPSTGSIVFTKTRESTQLNELLNNALAWDFEIFRLEELTERHPLVCLGLELFRRFDVYNTFCCDENTFERWLHKMEEHYCSKNTYHNSTHAADVMQH
ncbi:c-AMP specific cyclic nucleotide phosphodiesterase [Culex quinquefasciatus]|uniref:C-AMP specific cyclic nucleotide phosphodiesterase n=1 Tax=Culex quinquefasciatus TaxID=7176 RepID=B0WEQ0_CULQU|nr:c-AMP specific cyclic nucleotide phosphodiesterase [Culex quinquefasciatus]|eukprot:XP_001847184.1 c-AMP specific cyclic nucleotide phosphodiesterase [Culex quinquefasciatus]